MSDNAPLEPLADDAAAVRKLHEAREKILQQLSQVIVGQNQVIEELLISLFSRGHCLLEGVPGLAKTLMISTLARCLSLSFSRIQFTPDLMPADITGTEIIEENRSTGNREFRFLEGPLFANVDPGRRNQPHAAENAGRAAGSDAGAASHGRPRAASAVRSVLRAGHAKPDRAGRNLSAARSAAGPLHVQGVRQYPNFGEEFEIARRTTTTQADSIEPVLSAAEILSLQRLVRDVPVTDHVIRYTLVAGAADARRRAGRSGFRLRASELGRRAAGGAVPDPGRQGPGPAARPDARFDRRHPSPGQAGAAASPGAELRRRERRGHAGRGRRTL